ncbi:MAG: cob(I)yrinic acid a,c-diamide adenosyltransferase [Candidatus Lokiarchaeota archaeon]|nr:cob(I)yrinic acid a,c-diamide adenosyltransferase [Candidatus Harpocratesius repetitus]
MKQLDLGKIHFYYGMGTGKTSIAMGRIVRCLGHNLRPILVQFLKKHDPSSSKGFFYGEYITFTERLQIPVIQFGNYSFVKTPAQIEANRKLAADALKKTQEILKSTDYDLIVLDEIGSMVELGLYSEDDIILVLKDRNQKAEIIMTGHKPLEKIIDMADYVTYLQEIKHPFQKGVQARKGVEF